MSQEPVSPSIKQAAVALRGQYFFGDPPRQGLGLITRVSFEWLDVHTSSPPPPGSQARIKFSLSSKTGTVEAYGHVVALPDNKIAGFRLVVGGFHIGEIVLAEFLGLDTSSLRSQREGLASAPDEKRTSPRIAISQMLRVGTASPVHTAVLTDISESGLYYTIGTIPTTEQWEPKKNLMLELFVPMGPKTIAHELRGTIVRVDPPGHGKNDGTNWGIAIHFSEDHQLAPDVLQRIARHLGVYYPNTAPSENASSSAPSSPSTTSTTSKISREQLKADLAKEEAKNQKPPFLAFLLVIGIFIVLIYWLTMTVYNAQLDAKFGPPPTPRATKVPAPESP